MPTKADKIKQVNQIIELFEKVTTKKHKMWELLSGYKPNGQPYLKDSEWAKECSYKTFERRFREAIIYYQECSKIDRDKEVGLTKEKYDIIYYEAFKKGELNNAINALKAKRELFGLDKPIKHTITGKDEGPIDINNLIDLAKLTDKELKSLETLGSKINNDK